MIEIQQRKICNGVNFRGIRDSRFKTVRISVNFFVPLQNDTVAANALLPFLLSRASEDYPDYTKLGQKLAELYGADLTASVQKMGETQVLSISIGGLSDRYALQKETISEELAVLLCRSIFHPLFDEEGFFTKDGFDQERRQTVELIDSEYNDKRTYARHRCEQIMCKGEAFEISRLGSKEQIAALKRPEMTECWKQLLCSSQIEILVLGDCNPDGVYGLFSKAFSKLERPAPPQCQTEIVRKVQKVKYETETQDVAQSKLVMGFRAGIASPDKEVPATKLMTALLGGTPHSKLFLNVREKLSLCYYCVARYDSKKGIILVESGVETENIEKAEKEILLQLKEIQQGNFTEEEIRSTKLSMSNSYRTVNDYLGGMENWYLSQALENTVKTPQEAAEEINAVTREQIIQAANQVSLDTVYRLTGKEESSV